MCYDIDKKNMKSKIILFLLLLLANVVRANDGSYYVSGNQLILKEDGTALEKKILNNLPYANRGLVFQDKELQAFFEKQWWYMPDLSYKASADDFTEFDKELLEVK